MLACCARTQTTNILSIHPERYSEIYAHANKFVRMIRNLSQCISHCAFPIPELIFDIMTYTDSAVQRKHVDYHIS